jgi:hypothetical protein
MWNPIRRSRKIGRTQGGRVKDGRPVEKWSRVFSPTIWRRLSEGHAGILVLRENPSKGYVHPCAPEQVLEVIGRLPPGTTRFIKAVVLRRLPKSDEEACIEARRRCRCIILNSFPSDLRMVWRKIGPSDRKHYGRWCNNWITGGGKVILQWDLASLQRYYLFHLLLHEIGHFTQPFTTSTKMKEDIAESFALTWARELGELPASPPA